MNTIVHPTNGKRTVRDSRAKAPGLVMDLSRDDSTIHLNLCERFPHAIDLWWELDDDQEGWAYNGTKVLARLIGMSHA